MKVALFLSLLIISLNCNASLIIEKWNAEILSAEILPQINGAWSVSHGRISAQSLADNLNVMWTVSYDDTPDNCQLYSDGPNGVGEFGFGDDTSSACRPSGDVWYSASFDFVNVYNSVESWLFNNNYSLIDFYNSSSSSVTDSAISNEVYNDYMKDDFSHFASKYGTSNTTASINFYADEIVPTQTTYDSFFLNIELTNINIQSTKISQPISVNEPTSTGILFLGLLLLISRNSNLIDLRC